MGVGRVNPISRTPFRMSGWRPKVEKGMKPTLSAGRAPPCFRRELKRGTEGAGGPPSGRAGWGAGTARSLPPSPSAEEPSGCHVRTANANPRRGDQPLTVQPFFARISRSRSRWSPWSSRKSSNARPPVPHDFFRSRVSDSINSRFRGRPSMRVTIFPEPLFSTERFTRIFAGTGSAAARFEEQRQSVSGQPHFGHIRPEALEYTRRDRFGDSVTPPPFLSSRAFALPCHPESFALPVIPSGARDLCPC